ncbi:MAG: hypothetical protein ACMUIM_11240, partial [bacterium]
FWVVESQKLLLIKFRLPETGGVLLIIFGSAGNVVRTVVDEVQDVGYYTFTLTGWTNGGEFFSGTQVIKVVDNIPAGKN